jgi:hypothetical protein
VKRKGCLLLMLALMGPGCLSSGTHVAKESRKAAPVQMTIAPPPPPPPPPTVTPDQVTESNTPDIVQALSREMDYDATMRQRPVPPPPQVPDTMMMANTMKR